MRKIVEQLPAIYQRLIGECEYKTLPEMKDKPGALTLAMDGTVKDGYGGAAVILVDKEGNKLRSYLPIDGNSEQMDSFRAELCAILAGLLILNVMRLMSGIKTWKSSVSE